jgi:hypothetical protein
MFTCPTCRKQYQSRQGLRNHRAKSCAPRSTDSFTGRDMLEGRLSRPSRGECNLTTRKAKAGWRFSKPAVDALITEMGLDGVAIDIELSQGRKLIGTTSRDLLRGRYVVKVSQVVSRHQAMETLVHELTHVQQGEGFPNWGEFIKAYERYSTAKLKVKSTVAYEHNPYEVEARWQGKSWMDRFDRGDVSPTTRPA